MMGKRDFNDFLVSIGGFVDISSEKLPSPISLFGIECNDGWLELIAELIKELVEAGWTREIEQIKENFGMLCFYAEGLPENGRQIIHRYEDLSRETCERCGTTENVTLHGDNWVKTLCPKCAEAWLTRLKFRML